MQTHNEWRDLGLQLADAFDTLAAHGARARLHGQAALARMWHGKEPIEFVRGPATAHRVLDDGPLARLLHYPSAKAGSAKPVLIVSSLINRYYVLDLLRVSRKDVPEGVVQQLALLYNKLGNDLILHLGLEPYSWSDESDWDEIRARLVELTRRRSISRDRKKPRKRS